jgi:hypothetical protein
MRSSHLRLGILLLVVLVSDARLLIEGGAHSTLVVGLSLVPIAIALALRLKKMSDRRECGPKTQKANRPVS